MNSRFVIHVGIAMTPSDPSIIRLVPLLCRGAFLAGGLIAASASQVARGVSAQTVGVQMLVCLPSAGRPSCRWRRQCGPRGR
eukprot:2282080-Alexandrium_andersonii.AAC.1